MCKDIRFEKLWAISKILLLLSHGQASVERGFSVKRQIETENMCNETYIAQRIICDYVNTVDGALKVCIDKGMLLSVAEARHAVST